MRKLFLDMGIEPMTNRLRVWHSTTELIERLIRTSTIRERISQRSSRPATMGACASCTQAENTATCAEASQAQRPADEGIELLRSRDRPGGTKPGVHSPNPRPGVLSATEFQNVGRTGSPDKSKQFFANVERDAGLPAGS